MRALNAYIPRDRHQALSQQKALPHRTTGAVLFADLTGFTQTTAVLAQELGTQRGAEEINRQLNRLYGTLIEQIHQYGGSVISFSGDAITCWFDDQFFTDHVSAYRATSCALAMQTTMSNLGDIISDTGTKVDLAIKIAVAAGPARRFLVGNPDTQLIDAVAGHPLEQVGAAENLLQPEQTAVNETIVEQLGDNLIVSRWLPDTGYGRFALITALIPPCSPTPWPPRPQLSEAQTRNWLLPFVYERLSRGEEDFISELRYGVVLFQKFQGIDYDGDEDAGRKLHTYISWVQEILGRYEGYLLQLTIGDKGSYIYAVFGASLAHEDDPARAVAAALLLQDRPPNLSFIKHVHTGISQGQMYVGAYGGYTRKTYGALANTVNIAARLMGRAEPDQILVTDRVRIAAGNVADYQSLGLNTLKGIDQPIPIFAAAPRTAQSNIARAFGHVETPMVGREHEKNILMGQLQHLLEYQKSGLTIIEGEAGIGKSRLLAELINQARQLGCSGWMGAADAIEQTTPYYAWRPIFRAILDLNEITDSNEAYQQIHQRFPKDQFLLDRLPLLNAVLPYQWPDTELTEQITEEARALTIRQILIHILKHYQRQNPAILIVLEDGHWLDSASWALALVVQEEISPLLLVIGTRPLGDPPPSEYTQLRGFDDAQHLQLTPLSPDDVLTLVKHSLAVKELPPAVQNLVRAKAEGNPFFSQELAYALRDAGHITIENGVCRITTDATSFSQLDFPDTIQGVITSRIDHLTPAQQLTLKVASVIGRTFNIEILREIHPIEADKPRLEEYLSTLDRLDITLLDNSGDEHTYIFKHIITQEVAYNLMLFSQRQELHRAIAWWYEDNHAHDISRYYPLLAYHWAQADARSKAIDYYEKAGEQAINNFANEEAVSFFRHALDIEAKPGPKVDDLRRAQWELNLGEALVNWSQHLEGLTHLEEGLKLLGYPPPSSMGKLAWQLLIEIGRQIIYRQRPQKYIGSRQEVRDTLLPASLAYEKLAETYYFAQQMTHVLYSTVIGLNLAEAAGPSPELARSYTTFGAIVGFIPWHSAAEAYFERALQAITNEDNKRARPWVLLVCGIYYAGVGHWSRARKYFQQVITISAPLGNERRRADALSNLMFMDNIQGNFTSALRNADMVYASALQRHEARTQAEALHAKIYSTLHLGHLNTSINHFQELEELLTTNPNVNDETIKMETLGLKGLLHLHKGEFDEAFATAQETAALTVKSPPSVYVIYAAYTSAIEICTTLWHKGYHDDNLPAQCKVALKSLRSYARVLPIGKPALARYEGRLAWLRGKQSRAHAAWQTSLEFAISMNMDYDQAWAHYEIGRHLALNDPQRDKHFAKAKHIFQQYHSQYGLQQIEIELEK
ncbi:MAG TPA: AAA family ATPase [Anaerolineae bacterium]|nr:AAA family ATPase [Anaerolineae bacterium]